MQNIARCVILVTIMSEQRPDDNSNLLNFIVATIETIRDQMATKGDIARLEDRMATKSDVARLGDKLEVEIAAVRGDIEQVHLRLDSIERALTARLGQIEAEMSRLPKRGLSARQRQAGVAATVGTNSF